jgi:hypothetical protein
VVGRHPHHGYGPVAVRPAPAGETGAVDPLPSGPLPDGSLADGPLADATRLWAGLDQPWQEAFRLAWQATKTMPAS